MKKNDSEKGQVILVVVLCAVVALTVSLSIASRMVTSLKISKHNEESQRAFQAAEAGIAKALQNVMGDSGELSNNARFSASYDVQKGNQLNLNGGSEVDQDKGIDLWLSDYDEYTNPFNGSITIYWSSKDQGKECNANGDNIPPALEIIILHGSLASPKIDKYFYDYCGARENSASNPLSSASEDYSIPPQSYSFSTDIGITNGLLMRIVPIYNSAKIGVVADPSVQGKILPDQGTLVISTGYYGETQRKIQYFESLPQIPGELFYSIMAQNK